MRLASRTTVLRVAWRERAIPMPPATDPQDGGATLSLARRRAIEVLLQKRVQRVHDLSGDLVTA